MNDETIIEKLDSLINILLASNTDWLTVANASLILGKSDRHIRDLINDKQNKINKRYDGKSYYIHKPSLMQYIENLPSRKNDKLELLKHTN